MPIILSGHWEPSENWVLWAAQVAGTPLFPKEWLSLYIPRQDDSTFKWPAYCLLNQYYISHPMQKMTKVMSLGARLWFLWLNPWAGLLTKLNSCLKYEVDSAQNMAAVIPVTEITKDTNTITKNTR